MWCMMNTCTQIAQRFIINMKTLPRQKVHQERKTRAEEAIFLGDHELKIAEKLSAVFDAMPVSLLPFTYCKMA